MNGLISIIIPVYNAEAWLDRCVESVLAQDYSDFELLLADDGSTDRSTAMIAEWAKKDSRVRVFRQENRGQSAARNLGLDHVKGEYITFIDADDYVTPDYLSYLLSLFRPGCLFTACNHSVVRGSRKKANSASLTRSMTRREAFEEVLFHGCVDVSPWAKLYRREMFDGIRFPEGRIFEDTWLFGDILGKTEETVFGEKCCYCYVIHDRSTVRKDYSSANLQYIEAAERLAAAAVRCDPVLETGGIRRINHARMSVLRYMEHSPETETCARLREEILADAPRFIGHPRTPLRDRLAVRLLKKGLKPYFLCWKIYSVFR